MTNTSRRGDHWRGDLWQAWELSPVDIHDAPQHPAFDLVRVVDGAHVIGPAGASRRAM